MKSSIFTTNNTSTTTSTSRISSPKPRKPTYNQPQSKRYRSSSPYINNPKPKSTTSSSSSLLNKHPKQSSWNLDDLISSYQESGILPPILSPTLPGNHELHKSLSSSNLDSNVYYSEFESDLEDKVKGKEDEEVPRLLSPTLPSIFDTPISTPKPSYTSTPANSTFTNKRTESSTIKWINKMNDLNKPKFLLRIIFDNKIKYKRSMTKLKDIPKPSSTPKLKDIPKSSSTPKLKETSPKLNGLGILTDTRKEEKPIAKREKIDEVKKDEKKRKLDKKEESKNPLEQSLIDKEKSLKELETQLNLKQRELQELQNKLSQPSDEQRKREQLKQLTQDVIMREQSQPLEERIKLIPVEPTNLTKTQREEIKQTLQNKKNHWLQSSKTTKNKADSCKNEFLSIIIQIDSILLKFVAFDFDEQSKIIAEVLPSERIWKLLDGEIHDLIIQIERYSKNVKEKIIFEFLKILICILFQARAIILKRINSILTKVIDSYITKNDNTLNNKIIELQQLAINNHTLILEYFMNSKPNFLNANIPVKFPVTWFNKTLDLQKSQNEYGKFDYDIKPVNQVYYLPFGIYTNMNEFTAFLFNIIKEFIDIYNKYNVGNPIGYVLQCGQA